MSQLLFWSVLSFFVGFIFAPLLFFTLAVVLWVFGTVGLLGELGEAFDAHCGKRVSHDARRTPPQQMRFATKKRPPAAGWKRSQLKRRGHMLL